MVKTITEDDHVLFNTLRQEHQGRTFRRQDLRRLIAKELKFPAGEAFFIALISGTNPPIVQVGPGRYKFNDKPVYKDRLQKVFNDYHTRLSKYYEKMKAKRAEAKTTKKQIVVNQPVSNSTDNIKLRDIFTEENAIKLLKGLGYKIQKPKQVIVYEEV